MKRILFALAALAMLVPAATFAYPVQVFSAGAKDMKPDVGRSVMRMRRALLWAGAVTLVAGLLTPAVASATFAPTVEVSLASLKAGANTKVDVRVAQAAGEEPIDKFTFLLPAGSYADDASINDGEKLGEGEFTTSTDPFCSPAFQQTFDATLRERDRTAEEIQQGVTHVYVVDLGAVKVALVFTRTAAGGWRAIADVPDNPLVCSPFTLTATFSETSADSRTPIWHNPEKPGNYTVTSIVDGTAGSQHIVKQKIRITR
jgi:hypothetical protein